MLPKQILPILLAGIAVAHAQTPAPSGSPALDPKVKALIEEARGLQQNQRSYEALTKLDEADAISPGSAFIANVRGSIYTAPPLRDYAKARECFETAEKLLPTAFEPKFNKTELLYVEHKYAVAEAEFGKLLENFPKLREEVRHLLQFKIIICQLKQGKAAEAGKGARAFTFMDDTPAYYFTKAAAAFQEGDQSEARKWVGKATKIFKPRATAVYLDSLMEAGWLNSITAGDGTK
jgi:tetratricopeptide (TPR) repeat protein